MNTQLTPEAKDQLFERTKYIIVAIHCLCGDKVLYAQLITLLEDMHLANTSTTQIRADILALIKGGFLKKKQVLSTNSNMLMLTAYPLSRLLNIPSRDVPEVASSQKTILESICRTEVIINLLRALRAKNKIIEPTDTEYILSYMDHRNSTLCFSLKDINLYLKQMIDYYGTLLSEDFHDDYKYLEVIRMQKSNALSKGNEHVIDPHWLEIKETHQALQDTMSTDMQNQTLYNIANLKNSSADISRMIVEDDGRLHIQIAIYDNGNLTLERIGALTSYVFLMYSKYTIHYERPILHVNVICSCEEIKNELEECAQKPVRNFYGMRDATRLTQELLSNGVRAQYLENIVVSFRDLSISDKYNISYY